MEQAQPSNGKKLRNSGGDDVGNEDDSVMSEADLEQAMHMAEELGGRDDVEENQRGEEEEIEEIKTLWKPKLPTIVLFFRWARRPPSHFNSDSISLVKALALQSSFSPVRLLRDLKTYYLWTKSTHAVYPPYGFRLVFAQHREKGSYAISKEVSVALN
eukprot:scaffold717_cov49-Cylindrotheca_fusiformis.AAC.1